MVTNASALIFNGPGIHAEAFEGRQTINDTYIYHRRARGSSQDLAKVIPMVLFPIDGGPTRNFITFRSWKRETDSEVAQQGGKGSGQAI